VIRLDRRAEAFVIRARYTGSARGLIVSTGSGMPGNEQPTL
jgi:hypothetical protein